MKYQINMFYSLQVEAESEEQAEEKAGEFIASEEGQGIRLSDMSIEVERVGDEGQAGKPLDYVPPVCDECDCESKAEGRHEPECR